MKNSDRTLFICNTVYQVLVALWIKYHNFPNEEGDIIISDHMNGGKEISENLKTFELFKKVYYIQSRNFCHHSEGKLKKERSPRYYRKHPEIKLSEFIQLSKAYKKVFVANVDNFSRLIVNSMGHMQDVGPQVYLFEDGISTYSLLFKKLYNSTNYLNARTLRGKLTKLYYRDYLIYGNVEYALVFNPELMQWTPSENRKLDKIDMNDADFLSIVNSVFNYEESANEYDKKYIFMEEAYFADGKEIDDVGLVNAIADKVGKENIMIKIHPRNPVNRFKQLGYKTNSNTSIPWEVVCMNMKNMHGKRLITIASASIINPIMNFGIPVKAFSLYDIANKKNCISNESMYQDLWQTTRMMYEKYAPNITICKSLDEIG